MNKTLKKQFHSKKCTKIIMKNAQRRNERRLKDPKNKKTALKMPFFVNILCCDINKYRAFQETSGSAC